MNISIHEEPWLHGIVDDFISKDSINYFHESWNHSNPNPYSNPIITESSFIKELTEEIGERFTLAFNNFYHQLNVGGIGDETPYCMESPKCKLIVHDPFSELQRDIHLDSNDKAFSGVLYLSKEGTGTSLYYPNGKRHSQVEWKPNRALLFTRKQSGKNATYHAVENDIPFQRVTFIMNLHRDVEKVKQAIESGETWLKKLTGTKTNLPISKPLKIPK